MIQFREPKKKEAKVIESAMKYFGSDVQGKIAVLESKKREVSFNRSVREMMAQESKHVV